MSSGTVHPILYSLTDAAYLVRKHQVVGGRMRKRYSARDPEAAPSVKAPGSRAGNPQGRPHVAHPVRAAKEQRDQRLSFLCAILPAGLLGRA